MKTTNYLMAMLLAGASAVSAQDAATTETDSGAAQAVTAAPPSDAEESVKTEPKVEEKEKKGKSKKSDKDKKLTPYPLDTCIVTDNKLGSMGDPLTIVHENQEIKLCCKACEKKFKKDPEKYLGKLKPDA